MLREAPDDEQVMRLVELTLAQPPDQREAYLRSACGENVELLERVRTYVTWDERMNGFLLDPFLSMDAADQPFEPGELLDGRFRITRELAQGGMGIVYEALDEKLERRVALKCAKIGFRKRLPPEVRIATEISHPNVCKLFEIHTTSTKHGEIDFLTMEFLEGETLAERLTRGHLSEKQARTIAFQLCAGLAEAHRNQVIHGDLKSNNVILTTAPEGTIRAVITDFGLASHRETSQVSATSGQMAGTPDYMAPELWKGEKVSVASDIYALGVILSELGGRLPSSVIARCRHADPARRFRNADDVANALVPLRSRRWFLVTAAAIVVAAVTGLFTYQRATTPRESIRLAMLPLGSDRDTASTADHLFHDATGQLARLKGGNRAKLSVIPAAKSLHVGTIDEARKLLGATHVLHGILRKENDRVILHAFLTDARSQVNTKEWTAEYAPAQVQFAPVALAGLVTEALRLPPLRVATTVNVAARKDYLAGLFYVRRDTGVDTAVAFLERAVAADPDSPLTHAGLAEAQWFKYFLTKDQSWLVRATESLRQAELRNPDLAAVHRIAGILRANAGRYEQAEAEYRRAIELEPANSDAYRRLGQVLERNSQFEEALASYRMALDAEPNYYRTYQALGNFYYKKANYDEAVKYLSKAVELTPDEPATHFALGTTLTNLGRFSEAESEFRFALHLHETPELLHALGLALMYQARDQEAIPYFLSALKLSPERFLSWEELGNCYRRLNRVPDAIRANSRGMELAEAEVARNPRNGYVRSHLAYLCATLGDYRRAESEIAQALQLSPTADTQALAAFTFETLGRRDQTLAVLSSAPVDVLADLNRWPDLADLHKDPRFLQLLASNQSK